MSKQKFFPVFVDNIDSKVQVSDLRKVFAAHGNVIEVTIISKHGFVNFASPDEAVVAVRRVNGMYFFGNRLAVEYSKELSDFLDERERDMKRRSSSSSQRRTSDDGDRYYRQQDPRSRSRSSEHERHHHGRYQRHSEHPRQRTERVYSDVRDDRRYERDRRLSRDRDYHHHHHHERGVAQPHFRDHERQQDRDRDHHHHRPSSSSKKRAVRVDNSGDLKLKLESPEEAKRKRSSTSPISPDPDFAENNANADVDDDDDKTKDLRHFLKRKRTAERDGENIKIHFDTTTSTSNITLEKSPTTPDDKQEDEDEEQEDGKGQDEAADKGYQEMYVGNLFNPVEESDVVSLLESYGPVNMVRMFTNHAIARIECTKEEAEKAIENLDHNQWMDNWIRLKFSQRSALAKGTPPKRKRMSSHSQHCDRTESTNSPPKMDATETAETTSKDTQKTSENKKIRSRDIWVWCPRVANKNNFMVAMDSLFNQFGGVKNKTWKENESLGVEYAVIRLHSSEKQAVKAVSDLNGTMVKAQEIRVKFPDGSHEDSLQYHPQYSIQLRGYPKQLVPDTFMRNEANNKSTSGKSEDNEIIGVLPPTSSLGAFAALPDKAALTSIIKNVKAGFEESDAAASASASTMKAAPKKRPVTAGPEHPKLPYDATYISSVEAIITSVSSKIILAEFLTHHGRRLARLTPGQAFVDGKINLGYLIKNNAFHTWPTCVKRCLRSGEMIKMDVRRLSEDEMYELRDLTSEEVTYDIPRLWRYAKPRPTDELSVKKAKLVLKAVVVSLYPKWAVLRPIKVGYEEQCVFLPVENLFTIQNKLLNSKQSLLHHIEVGDTLAVLVETKPYLEMAEIARSAECFNERTDNLKHVATLAWTVASEVDPYAIIWSQETKDEKEQQLEANYLVSSSVLNYALPPEHVAKSTNIKGVIEELSLPGGGLITITDEAAASWPQEKKTVYFHRSRLSVNGVRISSSAILGEEIVVGDEVTCDLVENRINATSALIGGAYAEVEWVALSAKVNALERGLRISRNLRSEDVDPMVFASKVCQGRVVYFNRPASDTASDNSAVTSGLVVIDSGPYTGQRVEFEADQCYLFGYTLRNADLGQIFRINEPVCIMVKPYNSYCIDKLWIGPDLRNNADDQEGKMQFQKYLYDHGLERSAFVDLQQGQFPPRAFLPLEGQIYKGQVKRLKLVSDDDPVTSVEIESDVGDLLCLEASREDIYVFGHCMAKADLRYVLDNEEVHFEIHPVFERGEDRETMKASLVWLGGPEARPKYVGQSTSPAITPQMDAQLWSFVKSKHMDERKFRALVEGRLPPKTKEIPRILSADSGFGVASASSSSMAEVEGPTGDRVKVDQDVLKQAMLLQQMKSKFGPDAMKMAMAMLSNTSQTSNVEDAYNADSSTTD